MVDCRFRMFLGEPDLLFNQSMFDSNSRRIRKAEPERGVRRTMLATQGQGNSSTPCAACKLLRRRCAQECPFSPYFSPHEPQKFASVHKVFGASNVSKMLMEVPESQRADAASSLVYEANARIRDPVYGCMGAISSLQQQAQSLQADIAAVRQQINDIHLHRQRVHHETMSNGSLLVYPANNQNDRMSSGSLSTQTTASPDYTVPSPNGVGTPDVKDRFWSSMN